MRVVSLSGWSLGVLFALGCGARTELPTPDVELPADGSGGAPAVAAPVCQEGTFVTTKANPAVMFLLDRSQSMSQAFTAEGKSRWQVLRDALTASLPSVDDVIETGALLYPTPGASGSGMNGSCEVAAAANLSPSLGNVPALLSLVQKSSPGGATPTADAVQSGASVLLGLHAATTARALVVATDGGPDCNGSLDPQTCTCIGSGKGCQNASRCLDKARTVDRIAAYEKLGLPTYVIGIQDASDTSSNDVLDAMADAGGRAQTGAAHRYYAATSEAELSSALVAIRDQVACTYLTVSVPDDGGSLSVSLDGVPLPADGAEGWTWGERSNGEIVLHGKVCSGLQAGHVPVVEVQCSDGSAGAAGGAGTDASAGAGGNVIGQSGSAGAAGSDGSSTP